MFVGAPDATAESAQIEVNVRRQLVWNRIIQSSPGLGVCGGYIELPMIADFYEMPPNLQRCKRATAQRYHSQGANDQAVAELNGVPRPGAPDGVCRSGGTVHELDPECIEALTRDQVIFSRRPRRGGGDSIGDGLQPGPIGIRADELQRASKTAEIGGQRYVATRPAAPSYVFGQDLPIEPCLRWEIQEIRMLGR